MQECILSVPTPDVNSDLTLRQNRQSGKFLAVPGLGQIRSSSGKAKAALRTSGLSCVRTFPQGKWNLPAHASRPEMDATMRVSASASPRTFP